MNIYQRINAVRKKVAYVQKDKAVSAGAGGNYKAVTHDQVVAVCRDAMVEAGIVTFPFQVDGGFEPPMPVVEGQAPSKMRLYSGTFEIHFVNEEKPEEQIVVRLVAHAQDNGDKAPGKAVTYATKAALLKVLLLETGENEESRVEMERPVTAAQVKMLKDKLDNSDERIALFCEKFEIDTVEQLAKGSFDMASTMIDAANNKRKSGYGNAARQ